MSDSTFDQLMANLKDNHVVAFIRNCAVGTMNGVPATFNYGYSACLMWLKGKHMSRRETTEADGETPTAALKNVIEKALKEGMPALLTKEELDDQASDAITKRDQQAWSDLGNKIVGAEDE